MAIERIVVGVDGSANSQCAVQWAADLVTSTRSEIIAVHALTLLERLAQHTEPVPAALHRAEIIGRFENEWCSPLDTSPVQSRRLALDGPPVMALFRDHRGISRHRPTRGLGRDPGWNRRNAHHFDGNLAGFREEVTKDPGARPWNGEGGGMKDATDTNDVTLDRFGLEVLRTEVCWNLLRSSPIGRIAFVDAGEPMVFPVTHGVYGRLVVFRSGVGTKLEAAKMAHAVAFEVDEWDSASRSGWSVLARGVAETVYEADAIQEFEAVGVDPWLGAAERGDWVRIRVDEISGRRLGQ